MACSICIVRDKRDEKKKQVEIRKNCSHYYFFFFRSSRGSFPALLRCNVYSCCSSLCLFVAPPLLRNPVYRTEKNSYYTVVYLARWFLYGYLLFFRVPSARREKKITLPTSSDPSSSVPSAHNIYIYTWSCVGGRRYTQLHFIRHAKTRLCAKNYIIYIHTFISIIYIIYITVFCTPDITHR